jgi:hypothetical protein
MSAYRASWLRTGDPNGTGLPAWQRLRIEAPSMLEIDSRSRTNVPLPAEKRTLFQRHGKLGIFPDDRVTVAISTGTVDTLAMAR